MRFLAAAPGACVSLAGVSNEWGVVEWAGISGKAPHLRVGNSRLFSANSQVSKCGAFRGFGRAERKSRGIAISAVQKRPKTAFLWFLAAFAHAKWRKSIVFCAIFEQKSRSKRDFCGSATKPRFGGFVAV